jgi:hypothetical protein
MNTHAEECWAYQKLADARAEAAREHLVASLKPSRSTFRVALGLALIRTGRWLAGSPASRASQPKRLAA